MKTLKIVSCAVLMLGFFLSSGMPGAEAATFLGDFCWVADGLVRLSVTDMGGGHFLVHGRIDAPDTPGRVINGNAEIVGQQVFMTLTDTAEDATELRMGIRRVVLNLSTLNGTIETISHRHKKADPDQFSVFALHEPPRELKFVPCP